MESERTERKLAAILHADVVGYSRLMGEDEAGTLRTLTAYREVMNSLIEMHHGANFQAAVGQSLDVLHRADFHDVHDPIGRNHHLLH